MIIDCRGSITGLLLVGLLSLSGCGGTSEADVVDQENAQTSRVINVEVLEIVPTDFTSVIPLPGVVEANQDVLVSAEESGVIREIFVDKGQVVDTGQALLKIDDRILRSQTEEARARSALAQETWERRKRLWEEDRVGTELAYLEAKYTAEQAQASLETLEERLARTTIRAPIQGVLEARDVEVGTMVSAGTPVGRIVDLNPVKILAGVPERFATDVRVGTLATVSFDVLNGETFENRVGFVGATVNRQTRTFLIEILIGNPLRMIKPEMVANVELVRRSFEDAVVVPQDALVRVEDGFVVFVATQRSGQEVAEVRDVVLGPSNDNLVVVESGVEPGELLITVGQTQVADGDLVRLVGQG